MNVIEAMERMLEDGPPMSQEPQRIVMSGAEMAAFTVACQRVGVPPTSDYYWAWKLNDPLFGGQFSA